jgi:hypothetical protein
MTSYVYQNMIDLVVRPSIGRDKGVLMNAAMREHGAFDK